MATTTPKTMHLHDSYWTRPVQLGPEDADDMHSLSVAVNWPHRPQDVDLLLGIGSGLIARDEIGRVLGAGMRIAYTGDRGMIGMMMTHPKLQSGGLGALILQALIEASSGDVLRLNSTRQAWQLYRDAGFVDRATVVQYQGHVDAPPQANAEDPPRPATEADIAGVETLDRRAFGADRRAVLKKLRDISDVIVLPGSGGIKGFAFCRMFGRGRLIGPLVAGTEADAIRLCAEFVQRYPGSFLRLDADMRHEALGDYLAGIGLKRYDKVFAMCRGEGFGPEDAPDLTYALASQAMG